MVNTRTDADLSAAVQNALQAMLPRIREEIREEFRTGSGSSNAGGNPTPVTIHTWLERFNKQKPHSFEKATAPVDAENWISHKEKIFDVMGCKDVFKTRLAVYKSSMLWVAKTLLRQGWLFISLKAMPWLGGKPTSRLRVGIHEPGYETVGSKDLTCEDWTFLPQIRVEIREEFRTSFGPSDAGGNPPPISHMEKIFDVMGCEDAFKTRLAVYKFEGNALAWWKAYKQAKGGDAWLITVTSADFKKLFFLQFFPRAE
nr:zinc finger, CCHC-type, retrotransposon Gag domain protein [Tanacetum cinerariifolium]